MKKYKFLIVGMLDFRQQKLNPISNFLFFMLSCTSNTSEVLAVFQLRIYMTHSLQMVVHVVVVVNI